MPTPFPASLDALRQSLAETELSDAVVAHLVAQARPALVLATSAADEAAIPWARPRSAAARRRAWRNRRGLPIRTRRSARRASP